MEIKFFGGNCLRITTRQRSVVIDDNLDQLGAKSITKPEDASFFTNRSMQPNPLPKVEFMVDTPGEFELGNLMVQAYAVRAFTDDENQKTGVLYKFVADRISVVVTGNMHQDADSSLLESLEPVDVVFAPVGGGATMDAVTVQKVINKINPRYFVPTYYQESGITYPVPQDPLTKLIEELGQATEEQDVLKLKASMSPEHAGTQLITLKRTT